MGQIGLVSIDHHTCVGHEQYGQHWPTRLGRPQAVWLIRITTTGWATKFLSALTTTPVSATSNLVNTGQDAWVDPVVVEVTADQSPTKMCRLVLTKLLVANTGAVVSADRTVVSYLLVVVCINQTV